MAAKRDYKREYKLYHGKPEEVKRRAERNASRAEMVKKGKVRKGDGKDVDHKNHNTASGGKNLREQSKSQNRANNLGRGGRPKGK
jgi:hypothetical protein